VYAPIARELVGLARRPLAGHTVLDVGAGTGVASVALESLGARPIACDLSFEMLAWDAPSRCAAVVGDATRLPIAAASVDDVVAAFVLNHLQDPRPAIGELRRVTRDDGSVLACVYANASRSSVRDRIDAVAIEEGWNVPRWYVEIKTSAAPVLGTAASMAEVARAAGLRDVLVDERPVDVGVTEPEQLVAYRFGQAHYTQWITSLAPEKLRQVTERARAAIASVMEPYRPIVVFLSACADSPSTPTR
jgi:SAM-dependent methyltransferase